jgi:hypothetical protein
MKLNFTDIDDFFNFLPLLIILGIENDDYMSNDAAEFYSRLNKKIRSELNRWFLQNPSYRQQIKRFTAGLENGENIVISIKVDKQSSIKAEQVTQYLTEKYEPIKSVIMKHLEK